MRLDHRPAAPVEPVLASIAFTTSPAAPARNPAGYGLVGTLTAKLVLGAGIPALSFDLDFAVTLESDSGTVDNLSPDPVTCTTENPIATVSVTFVSLPWVMSRTPASGGRGILTIQDVGCTVLYEDPLHSLGVSVRGTMVGTYDGSTGTLTLTDLSGLVINLID